MNTHTANILNTFPNTAEQIDISRKKITGILDLKKFNNLKKLNCKKI